MTYLRIVTIIKIVKIKKMILKQMYREEIQAKTKKKVEYEDIFENCSGRVCVENATSKQEPKVN